MRANYNKALVDQEYYGIVLIVLFKALVIYNYKHMYFHSGLPK